MYTFDQATPRSLWPIGPVRSWRESRVCSVLLDEAAQTAASPCEVLEGIEGLSRECLDQMQAMVYLVGTFDRPGVNRGTLRDAGLPPLVTIGAKAVHGLPAASPYNHYRALRIDFQQFKLVRGALAVAELETAPEDGGRRCGERPVSG
ncbi:MAG: hypothetical protein JXX28_06865 [Deltaproteobacteria bacterium]|nr:hypothetical protein [Deltaproteobacteria bacterium]